MLNNSVFSQILKYSINFISDSICQSIKVYVTRHCKSKPTFRFLILIVFSATLSNISTISWRPLLVVEEAGENHRPWASNW